MVRNIAACLGQPFEQITLGGIRDEAEIRGFNRTYVGSQPGRIIQGLKRAGSSRAVLLLDELDKISSAASGHQGNPAAALLEVLDPKQNAGFIDHYVGVPFDLSKITFVCTANTISSIPGPLLDRLEVIELSGYTLDEKVSIALLHLLPRQRANHGLQETVCCCHPCPDFFDLVSRPVAGP